MTSVRVWFVLIFFAQENMKKPASKVAKPAQIQPKSQFLFHKISPNIYTVPEGHALILLQDIVGFSDSMIGVS